MKVPFLDLVAQHRPLRDELLQAFGEALDAAAFASGARVAAFEREFADYVGCRHVVALSNGTEALRLAMLGMGVAPGDTVLTVPNTFIATTEAISQAGARFAFVDVDPATCLMDPARLEDYLKRAFDRGAAPRPKAILPVHLYGQCADMEAIMALAARYDLGVLEDAAQAHGAKRNGRGAGTFGTAAAFSFYPGKNLGACGEAGAVGTDDDRVAERVRMLRDHGQRQKYLHALEGCNARMDELQACALRIKLRHLDAWNDARRRWAAIYNAALAGSGAEPVAIAAGNVSNYHLYVVHAANRDALKDRLAAAGIGSGLHYPVPLHLQECYASLGEAAGAYPNAERSAARLLSLPMYPELGEERARHVAESVLRLAGNAA
jgi:dTDP-4-amino-4,6-dideoxygalactose transaminase